MIRKLLATTAIASIITTGAFAQDATAPAPAQPTTAAPAAQDAAPAVQPADGFLATKLIGENVYNGTGDGAENIGNVNDLVLGSDGAVQAVIVGVGGFLGIGEKNVALSFSELKWAANESDRWIVVSDTKEQLEGLPDFDRRPYEVVTPVASDTTAPATETTAMAPAATDTTAAPATQATDQTAQDTTTVAPTAPDVTTTAAIDRNSLKEVPTAEIRSEELVGTTVYGAEDANVGEIGDVVLNTDGKIDAVIIDVGGFLGIGEKEVAVGIDNLAFMQDANGNKYLYTNFTKEQLEAQAAYDEGSYAQQRDTQRLVITK
jgi:sporulation protein YlmC with PRC-barrel domain